MQPFTWRLVAMLLPLLALLAPSVQAARILLTNDDGWAELSIRAFYDALTLAGHDVLLVAPASDRSANRVFSDGKTRNLHANLEKWMRAAVDLFNEYIKAEDIMEMPSMRTAGCQYKSCPRYPGAIGHNESNPRLNWVNSQSPMAVRYGLDELCPKFFGGPPDIVISGINVGMNYGRMASRTSQTISAAHYAASRGFAAIAISGGKQYWEHSDRAAWNTTEPPSYVPVFTDLAMNLTNKVLAHGIPYMPANTFLNVNFKLAQPELGVCPSADRYTFHMTRNERYGYKISSIPSLRLCGRPRMHSESTVLESPGCYATVSVLTGLGDRPDRVDVDQQKTVYDNLDDDFWTCLGSVHELDHIHSGEREMRYAELERQKKGYRLRKEKKKQDKYEQEKADRARKAADKARKAAAKVEAAARKEEADATIKTEKKQKLRAEAEKKKKKQDDKIAKEWAAAAKKEAEAAKKADDKDGQD